MEPLHDPLTMKGDHHVTLPFSLTAGAILGAILISNPAAAQQSGTLLGKQTCMPRDAALGMLTKQFKERPIAIGVTTQGGLIELLTSNDGLTWTILLSTPQGVSCLVAEGEGWRALAPTEGPEA